MKEIKPNGLMRGLEHIIGIAETAGYLVRHPLRTASIGLLVSSLYLAGCAQVNAPTKLTNALAPAERKLSTHLGNVVEKYFTINGIKVVSLMFNSPFPVDVNCLLAETNTYNRTHSNYTTAYFGSEKYNGGKIVGFGTALKNHESYESRDRSLLLDIAEKCRR